MKRPSYSFWLETTIVTVICGLIIIIWSYSSFSKPFFAENFQYVGQFRAADGNWSQFLFSPTQDGWFKPGEKLIHILLFLVLPLRAEAYHIANFMLVIGIVILLHRFLLLYVKSLPARVLPLMYFSTLSVHLTLIGYINLFGTILVSFLYLAAIYTFCMYFIERRISFLVIGSLAAFLSLFIKETAIVILPVTLVTLVAGFYQYKMEAKDRRWLWLPIIVILIGIMLLFLGRLATTGSLLSTTNVYSPKLSLEELKRNLLAFASGISNTSFNDSGITGYGGIGNLLYGLSEVKSFKKLDGLIAFIFVIWLAWLLFKARVSFLPLLIAITLASTTFAIHLLTTNLQSYYRIDFLVAITIILALALDQLTRPALVISCLFMLIAACNGFISNQFSHYHWQFTANQAEAAFQSVRKQYKTDYNEIRFSTSNVSFWLYALGRGIPYSSMIPERLGNPDLKIGYFEPGTLPIQECGESVGVLCIDLDNGFSKLPPEGAN